jgi:hypothetical protein
VEHGDWGGKWAVEHGDWGGKIWGFSWDGVKLWKMSGKYWKHIETCGTHVKMCGKNVGQSSNPWDVFGVFVGDWMDLKQHTGINCQRLWSSYSWNGRWIVVSHPTTSDWYQYLKEPLVNQPT